ncbi:MAG TPA: hypothetical protein VHV77_06090, partial [Pirellulales bacterium]|nr:hypothetical protein [Pirellulales bacterium]
MKRHAFLPLAIVALATLLAPIVLRAQASADPAANPATQTVIDPAIRSVVEQFFRQYAAKDLSAFMAIWSNNSPDYA